VHDLNQIDVAILCGGLGKRLRAEIGESQKVMATIGREPFLDVLLKALARAGFKRFILMTGYQADAVEEYYRKKKMNVAIEFSRENEPLGTGGALKNAKALIQSDPFVCMNGDSLCSLDYQEFLNFYSSKKMSAALVLSKVRDNKDFGTIILDQARRIISFQEKQKILVVKKFYVNVGVYCFSKKIFDWMPSTKKFMLETDFFPQLVQKEIYGFITQQNFLDIGTPERFKKAQTILRKDIIELLFSKQNSKTLASVDSASESFRVGKEKLNKHLHG